MAALEYSYCQPGLTAPDQMRRNLTVYQKMCHISYTIHVLGIDPGFPGPEEVGLSHFRALSNWASTGKLQYTTLLPGNHSPRAKKPADGRAHEVCQESIKFIRTPLMTFTSPLYGTYLVNSKQSLCSASSIWFHQNSGAFPPLIFPLSCFCKNSSFDFGPK